MGLYARKYKKSVKYRGNEEVNPKEEGNGMYSLLGNIISYIQYLRKEHELQVSIHFKDEKIRCFPEQAWTMLAPYNAHHNPYCVQIKEKKENWEKCRASQKLIMQENDKNRSFCYVCYAGVYEAVYLVWDEGEVAGYIAVSGYRKAEPEGMVFNTELWKNNLKEEEIPLELCDILIPPLGRMFELLFSYPMGEPGSEYNLMLQFIHERHGKVTLPQLCRHFGRSKSYVSHMFHRKSGKTLRVYCNDLKLSEAKNMLRYSGLPITEIAYDAGFNDVSYFIHIFKEKFGMTPLQFRKAENMEMQNEKKIGESFII